MVLVSLVFKRSSIPRMILKACKWVVSQERGAYLQNVNTLDNNYEVYLACQKFSSYIMKYSEIGHIQKGPPPVFVNNLDKVRNICANFFREVIT